MSDLQPAPAADHAMTLLFHAQCRERVAAEAQRSVFKSCKAP